MTEFTIHSKDSAPEAAAGLARVEAKFGSVINLLGIMAESPAALNGYLALAGELAQSSFSPAELQLIQLTVSVENNCLYCVPAHSYGGRNAGLDQDAIEAVRNGQAIADPRLETLRRFTAEMTLNRGQLADGSLEHFLEAGFTKRQAFEVVTAIAAKTITNYIDALSEAPLDAFLKTEAWQKLSRAP